MFFLIVSIKVKTLKMLSTLTDRLTDRKTDVSMIFPNPESPTQTLFRLVNKQNTTRFFFYFQAFNFQINTIIWVILQPQNNLRFLKGF